MSCSSFSCVCVCGCALLSDHFLPELSHSFCCWWVCFHHESLYYYSHTTTVIPFSITCTVHIELYKSHTGTTASRGYKRTTEWLGDDQMLQQQQQQQSNHSLFSPFLLLTCFLLSLVVLLLRLWQVADRSDTDQRKMTAEIHILPL